MGQGFAGPRIGVNISAGTLLGNTGTVVLSNANGISFGMSTNASSFIVTASINVAASIAGIAAGTQTGSTGTIALANSNGISFGMSNSSQITASSGYTVKDFENFDYDRGLATVTNLTAMSELPFFIPFALPWYLTFNRLVYEASRSTTGSNSWSVTVGIYTLVNQTSAALLGSFSNSISMTNTANGSGNRQFQITSPPAAITALTPGYYVLGVHFHTLGGTASMNYLIRGIQSTQGVQGVIGAGADVITTATAQIATLGQAFFGKYSATTASLPNNIGISDLWANGSGATMPVGAWFRLEGT